MHIDMTAHCSFTCYIPQKDSHAKLHYNRSLNLIFVVLFKYVIFAMRRYTTIPVRVVVAIGIVDDTESI